MTYVMSDIHGYYDKFLKMLEKINFTDNDTMIIIGDVIDRGPQGITMLKDIMGRKNVMMTMGNHELMMLESLLGPYGEQEQQKSSENWIQRNGGYETMKEIDPMTDEELMKIIAFISELPTAIDLELGGRKFHMVHAWPCKDCYDALWTRPELDTPSPLLKEITLIVGHTPVMFLHAKEENDLMDYIEDVQKKGEHLKIEHCNGWIDLDCGAGQNLPISRVACLRLDDMEEFYV